MAGARAIKTGSRVALSIKIACTWASLTHEGNESSRDSWPFLWWTGQNWKVGSAYLHGPCTNEYHCCKKRLGHFTVSSQEEQIASALHDHSRDQPERGLCSPRGEPECHGLAAEASMWSYWNRAGVACCTFNWRFFGPVFPTSTQSGISGSGDLNLNPYDLKSPGQNLCDGCSKCPKVGCAKTSACKHLWCERDGK